MSLQHASHQQPSYKGPCLSFIEPYYWLIYIKRLALNKGIAFALFNLTTGFIYINMPAFLAAASPLIYSALLNASSTSTSLLSQQKPSLYFIQLYYKLYLHQQAGPINKRLIFTLFNHSTSFIYTNRLALLARASHLLYSTLLWTSSTSTSTPHQEGPCLCFTQYYNRLQQGL